MAKITEKDALAIIQSGAPFSIQFVTANRSKRTGGKRITSMDAVVKNSSHSEMINGTITIEMADHDKKVITLHRKLIEFVNKKQVIC